MAVRRDRKGRVAKATRKTLVERPLEAEMNEHLGYGRHGLMVNTTGKENQKTGDTKSESERNGACFSEQIGK